MATAVPEGLAGQSIVMLRVGRGSVLVVHAAPVIIQRALCFERVRAQIRDLHTDNIANPRVVAAVN
jgi:hypothetical protein